MKIKESKGWKIGKYLYITKFKKEWVEMFEEKRFALSVKT